ncbi:hypothetical protein BH09PSE5_BH09PSE5_22540 [soil metagenome]
MDTRLLGLLVCPICKGPLQYETGTAPASDASHASSGELICRPDRLAYPIRDGIPLMLEDQARAWDPELAAELASRPVSLTGDTTLPSNP